MNSNSPWELIPEVVKRGGDIFRVRVHDGRREIVPYHEAPFTEGDAAREALQAIREVLPQEIATDVAKRLTESAVA